MRSKKMKRFHMPITLCLGVFIALAAPGEQPAARCLDTIYPSFNIETHIIRNAMSALGRATGLQVCGYWQGADMMEKKTIDLDRFTGREAMDALVAAWPEYEWFEGPGNVVIVLPHGALDDPDFCLNTIIEETHYDQAPVREIVDLLIEHTPRQQQGSLGMVIHGPNTNFESAYGKSALFSVSVPRTTLLDHLNQVMVQFDGIMSWQISTGSLSYQYANVPVFVKTADMQEADIYARSDDMDPTELLRKYDQAAASAPLETLRQFIALQKAEVHRKSQPLGASSLREAETVLNQAAQSDDPAFLGIQIPSAR